MPFFRRKSRNTASFLQENDILGHEIEAARDTLNDSIMTEEMCKDLHKQQKAASKLNKSLQNELEKLTKKLRNQTDLEIKLKRYQDKLDKLDHLNRIYERQTERAKEQLSLQKTQESQLKALKEREALLRQKKFQIEDNLSLVSPSDRDLLKRIKEKEAAIQQLQQETEDLQHTFEEIQVSLQKNKKMNKQLKVLQEKENSLKDSGVKLASEIKKVKNENIMYESIIEELEAKQKTLEKKNRKFLELEEEHKRIEDVKKVFKLKIHHLEKKNWALSKEIQSFQTAFESKENAKAELLALKEEKALLQNNTLRLQQEIQKHKIENPFQMQIMQAETDSLKIKIQGEKQSVQQTQQEVCALEQELQALRDAAHQNEELRVELSKLKAERRMAQNSLFKLKNEIQQLEKSCDDCNVMQHKVELERKNLTKEGKNLNTLQKHYRNVTIEIEALKHKIKLSGDEHQALLEEHQSLKRDLEQKTKAEVELDGLRRKSSSLNNVIDTLKQKIQRQKAELQHLPGHVNSMLSGGTASSYDPQTLSRIVNDERIAVKNLKQEARDLETQLREVEESSTSQRSLRTDLERVLAERKLVQESNSRLKTEIRKLQNELKEGSRMKYELVAQRKVLVTLKEEEEEMEKESQRIKAEILDLQLNKSKLADEKQALSQKIQEKTSKIKMGVEAELTSLRKVSSSHKEGIEQMKQEIQRLKAELKQSVEELAFEFKDMPDALTFENLFELVEKEKFDIQKLEEEGRLLQIEIQDVKDSITLRSDLEEELKYLQSQKKLVQDIISKLKHKILNLPEDFDGYNEIRAEVLSERETPDALTQQEQDLEEEYVKTKADVSAIREKSKKAPLLPVPPEKTQKTVRLAGEPKRFLKEPRPKTPPSSASDSESQPETRGTRGTRDSSPVFEESTAMSEKMSKNAPLPPVPSEKTQKTVRLAGEPKRFLKEPRPKTPPTSASDSKSQPETEGTWDTRGSSPVFEESTAKTKKKDVTKYGSGMSPDYSSERESLDALINDEMYLNGECVKLNFDDSDIQVSKNKKAPLPPVLPEETQKMVKLEKSTAKTKNLGISPDSSSEGHSPCDLTDDEMTFEEFMRLKTSDLTIQGNKSMKPLIIPTVSQKTKNSMRKADEVTGFNRNPRPKTPPLSFTVCGRQPETKAIRTKVWGTEASSPVFEESTAKTKKENVTRHDLGLSPDYSSEGHSQYDLTDDEMTFEEFMRKGVDVSDNQANKSKKALSEKIQDEPKAFMKKPKPKTQDETDLKEKSVRLKTSDLTIQGNKSMKPLIIPTVSQKTKNSMRKADEVTGFNRNPRP